MMTSMQTKRLRFKRRTVTSIRPAFAPSYLPGEPAGSFLWRKDRTVAKIIDKRWYA